MKVIFAIRYFHPFVGGTEKQALTLASYLGARGIDVTILTSRFRMRWPRTEYIRNVRLIRLPSPRIKVAGALIFLACLACHLIRERKHYAIMHAFQIGYTSFVSILCARILGKPSLIKLASSGSGGDIRKARETAWGKLCLRMAKGATRVIAVSDTVKKELLEEQVPSARIACITNGVDLEMYKPNPGKAGMRKLLSLPEKTTVLYTGRLSPEKGIDFLIRGYALLEQNPACQLVIIGNGPDRKVVMRMITELHLDNSVLLVCDAAEVAPYFQASDLFVLPSRFEGLSNALLEAMSCGLPVISTRVGGSKDIIADGVNGLLVEVDEQDQLRTAMTRVLCDRELAATLGANARKTAEAKHDMKGIAKAYGSLYRDLTSVQY